MDKKQFEMSRRSVLKYGMMSGALLIGSKAMSWAQVVCPPTLCPENLLPEPTACGIQEVWATTPFIVNPFTDPLPQPQALRPGYLTPDGQLLSPNDPAAWAVRKWTDKATGACQLGSTIVDPGLMEDCMQDSYGASHSVKTITNNAAIGFPGNFPVAPDPILYHIRLKIAAHNFASANVRVRPIDKNGNPMTQAQLEALGIPIILNADGTTTLPASTIYGFNGTFPGPMINVDYGKPVIVRFECDLDSNPLGLDISDFGVPQFLSHLHNGHTAPESDGNPHYMQHNEGGYIGGDYVDNLYLNWPAGGDPNEMQSFLWFHDHRMHHTGANVYKGMVGLFPMYDPGVKDANGNIIPGTGLDPGDETNKIETGGTGLGLPGVRVDNGDGSFDVKYDIPMALFDCRLDDGFTPHADFRIGDELIVGDPPAGTPPPADPNVCGGVHPNQWGKTFFRYHPNHGFVGDLFTVNCVAFPLLNVERRKYRLRFLGASIARCYEIAFMTSQAGPQARPGTDGQWQIPDGVLWKQNAMTQIASMGGLLPNPIPRDLIQIWPAQRREVVVDFSDAQIGDVIYITNVLDMKNGRKPDFNDPDKPLEFKVPIVKIVVTGDPEVPDQSQVPANLRPMPAIPTPAELALLPHREFTLHRSGQFGDDSQWLINGLPFDPTQSLTELPGPGNPGGIGNPKLGSGEVWILKNGGGGWTHPMHIHQEEHTNLLREGGKNPDLNDPGKEDVANLDEGETVTVFRRFRTFTGQYVAHCHNLAHEDHNMMFGWKIEANPVTLPTAHPLPHNDFFDMKMNTIGVIPVLDNDTTFDGKPLTDANVEIQVLDDAINGVAVVDGKTITYTPNTDFIGVDHFHYTITLDGLTSHRASVTVSVTSVNAPVAKDDVYLTKKNNKAVIPVLDNDTMFDGSPLPAEGALITIDEHTAFNGITVVDGKTIVYTPDPDWTGTDVFHYTITLDGLVSNHATVFVTVANPVLKQLKVDKAIVKAKGKRLGKRGPRWNLRGSGAEPKSEVTIKSGDHVVATVKVNRFGRWRFFKRAVPGLQNPTSVTISSPGAQDLIVPLTVK